MIEARSVAAGSGEGIPGQGAAFLAVLFLAEVRLTSECERGGGSQC